MKSFATKALSALVAVSLMAPILSTEAEARRGRGAALGLGIGLGILGAAAIAGSNRAYADDHYYEGPRYRDQCGKWNYRCNRGSDWACEKFDRHC